MCESRETSQQVPKELGLEGVDDEDDGGNKGRLERLLHGHERDEVEDAGAHVLVVSRGIDNELRDGLHLLVPALQWRLGQPEELFSDACVRGRVVSAALIAAVVVIVV